MVNKSKVEFPCKTLILVRNTMLFQYRFVLTVKNITFIFPFIHHQKKLNNKVITGGEQIVLMLGKFQTN